MRRALLLLMLAVAMVLTCAGMVLAQRSAEDEEFVTPGSSLDAGDPIPNRYIVVLKDDVTRPRAVARELARQLDFKVTRVYKNALKGFVARVPEGMDLPAALSSDPRVEFVAQNLVIEASAQSLPTGVDRVEADESSTQAGNGSGAVPADIAILDTGIYNHTDLKIAGGHACTGRSGDGYSDDNGHGTHVAGTAAAKDNSIGVVGVAPGARLWAVKVLKQDGSGSIASVICGIDWVTGKNTDGDPANNIEVANMSLGATVTGTDDNSCGWNLNNAAAAMHRAICNSVDAGVFYAVAAGNDSKDFLTDVPAAFNEVLTVTAMADFDGEPGGKVITPTCRPDQDDTNADFSNYTAADPNDDDHTIAAPGVCIESTRKGGGYETSSGTSMASPHVAGTAALCIATSGTTGKCTGGPLDVMSELRSDAAAQPASYGFVGDPPQHPPGNPIYYGFLLYAGGY
jgi:subtilisin